MLDFKQPSDHDRGRRVVAINSSLVICLPYQTEPGVDIIRAVPCRAVRVRVRVEFIIPFELPKAFHGNGIRTSDTWLPVSFEPYILNSAAGGHALSYDRNGKNLEAQRCEDSQLDRELSAHLS